MTQAYLNNGSGMTPGPMNYNTDTAVKRIKPNVPSIG